MADAKLSELTEVSSIGASDEFYVVQSGTSKKTPIGKIAQGIKMTNVTIPGLGFEYNGNTSGYIEIYDSESSIDPLIRIDNYGIDVRGEELPGGDIPHYNISIDELINLSSFFDHDSDSTDISTGDSYIYVRDLTTDNEAWYKADAIQFYYDDDGTSRELLFNINKLIKLNKLIPTGSGQLKSDDGYYLTPSSKKPEAMVVELYAIDTQTMEPTDTLVQGAKYRSDGIEYYDGNGSIGSVSAEEISYLDGVTSEIQTQIDGKGDTLSFDDTTRILSLKSGNTVISQATISGGGSSIKLADVSGAAVTSYKNTATLTWTDPSDIVISGITFATWEGTKVVRKAGSAPQSISDGTVVVDSKVRSQYSSSGYTDTGLTYGTLYYYRFFPYTTDNAVTDGTSVTCTPEKVTISTLPSQNGTLTYNGSQQTASFNNYDSNELDVTGNTGTNAGTYTATFTPKSDYKWWDNTTSAKTVSWTIDKATGSISLSPNSVNLDTTTLYEDVTITQIGDGTLSVSSSDTSIATVGSITSGVFRVSAVDGGTATITVSSAATTNYTSATATLTATVSFISNTLNDNSWSVISSASSAGTASSHWSVGDCKEIKLNGTIGTETVSNKSVYVFILGFNHNASVEGNGISFGCFKTALTSGTDIALTDSMYSTSKSDGTKAYNMNHWGGSSTPYNTNYGGWKGCDARYDILGSTDTAPSGYGSTPLTTRVGYDASSTTATNPVSNTLMSALPSDLRSVMKPITKYTDNTGNSSNIQSNVTASTDYLPLLAEYEVFGTKTNANQYEQNSQTQYSYYANSNSKIKYQSLSETSAAYWWCRSPRASSAATFCYVSTSGSANGTGSRTSHGLAPAFLV